MRSNYSYSNGDTASANMSLFSRWIITAVLSLVLAAPAAAASSFDWRELEDQAVSLLSRYIQIDTTNPPGNEINAPKTPPASSSAVPTKMTSALSGTFCRFSASSAMSCMTPDCQLSEPDQSCARGAEILRRQRGFGTGQPA